MSIERVRWLLGGLAVALLLALTAVPAARADFPTLYGGDVSCAAQAANGNVRLCAGETATWDGATKIDLNVVLPPQPSGGEDGPYPVIGLFHGWRGKKIGLEDKRVQEWAEEGYAVFSMSDRGWGNSCGGSDPERFNPLVCGEGYNHLMDDRYEVRDAQYLISILADEGVAEPKKIGATGVSYGGGMSMALATLRNRTMLPDGSLVAWESPGGIEMELAAAVPQWPWTDLAYSLMPNGSTLDFVADSPYKGPDGKARIGIEKASYVGGLFGTGAVESNYAPPGSDPEADLIGWKALIDSGEPYEPKPQAQEILDQITTYHSSYYIDHSQPPAPLLIQNGWNDDLFPVDEAVRYYNRTRAQYPGDPISLFLMDDGHARSQNKAADEALFLQRENAWFDHYLKGEGTAPSSSVEALTTTCPKESASEGPYKAADWQALSPGEIQLDGTAAQTIVPGAGNPDIGKTFDPIAEGDACATAPGADQPGVANYRLQAPAAGFTLLGSPTIVADITTTNVDSELAARLLDVLPNGEERLVARGLLRPGNGGTGVVFQLHPQGYRFAGGDTAKLELLPSDAPYARPSNMQTPITVSNLRLRLPVLEQPGSLGGVVQIPSDPTVGPGTPESGGGTPGGGAGAGTIKAGIASLLKQLLAGRRSVALRLSCAGGDCSGRVGIGVGSRNLASATYAVPGGQTTRLQLRLTKAGRKLVRAHRRAGHRSFRVKVELNDAGQGAAQTLSRRLRLRRHS
ncbi:MAG TPA: CocE/NonD family hydrolase [Solirubrobacterales bacterium]|jgi:predicted acyl esterase|nr:CocE/NonD family hydrolase [Solirubrobacterales bacterium]